MHVAMLCSITACFSVHPIHVWRSPITCDKGHTPLDHLQHGIQLVTARTHWQNDLSAFLAHRRGESEVVTVYIKFLRECERLGAIDGVSRTDSECATMSLNLWVSPLVACPIWVITVVMSASMICDLLNVHVALIHVKLGTAAQTREALRITVVVMVLAWISYWHIHQVEIQVAPTPWAISAKIDVH